MTTQEIEESFSIKPEELDRTEQLCSHYRNLAHTINMLLTDSREKSIAMTKLQESFLFALIS